MEMLPAYSLHMTTPCSSYSHETLNSSVVLSELESHHHAEVMCYYVHIWIVMCGSYTTCMYSGTVAV